MQIIVYKNETLNEFLERNKGLKPEKELIKIFKNELIKQKYENTEVRK